MLPIPVIDERMIQGSEKKRPAFAALTPDLGEVIFFEEPCEKSLGQVLGLDRIKPTPANVGVKGIPISSAENLERFPRLGRERLPGGQHQTPPRRDKPFLGTISSSMDFISRHDSLQTFRDKDSLASLAATLNAQCRSALIDGLSPAQSGSGGSQPVDRFRIFTA